MTLFFSEAILQFTSRLLHHAKAILRDDMNLNVSQKRFIFKGYSYPITIVCFEHSSALGFFDPSLLEISIHKDLILNESLALEVLKHELAHYIAYLEFGCLDHGKDFHTICKRYNFPKEVAKAVSYIPKLTSLKSVEAKVRKLLSLSKNSNIHESHAALLKAEELIQKHGLSSQSNEESGFTLMRILKQNKTTQKQKAIGQMLRHFNVEVVHHLGKGATYVEILGLQQHVEIASYVADFLDHELDHLWTMAQKTHKLKGLSAKNSFFRGLAKGYDEQKRTHTKERALILANLQRAVSMVYPKLSRVTSRVKHDAASHGLGKKAGKSMNVKPGLTKAPAIKSITNQ
ncbi:MAG: SprT-like domain-containing protein [Rhabdochlamydiaceae bacterium]|nr:SprT-like domain-containing protein [Candidatus Amphrikana amoebophyrae]